MKEKTPKYLVETSAILAAIGYSSRLHSEHFKQQTADGILYSSNYVRKEVIRRFVCDIIEYAEMMDQCERISDAQSWWSEQYGRRPKCQGLIDSVLSRNGVVLKENETHLASIEIAQIALDVVNLFDRHFKSKIPNNCGCKIGGVPISVDGRSLVRSLAEFRKAFLLEIPDCPVNGFLQIQNPQGRAARMANSTHLQVTSKIRKVRQPLGEILGQARPISCARCSTIGDPIIAMEQPPSWVLVHIDSSYDHLCAHTAKRHKKIRSNSSFRPKK